jgi:hypothetical protein
LVLLAGPSARVPAARSRPDQAQTPFAAPAAPAQFRVDDLQELGGCSVICRFLAIRQRLPELQ